AEDVMDKATDEIVAKMQNGEILMLENIRFYPGEEENDEEFAKRLASLCDIFVFEAFATAHRKHASTYGITKFVPAVAGFLVEKELNMFDKILTRPEHPYVAILGGAKVSDKLPVIENLIDKVDALLIGGGMAYTFVKSIGGSVGNSLVDNSKLELAKAILDKAKEKGVKVLLPIDNVGAKTFDEEAETKHFVSGLFGEGYQGMDIGPKTCKAFKREIKHARTIVWNGPLGVYEYEKFRKGTDKVAKYVSKNKGFTLIGGGDSIAAVKATGRDRKITHLSTGGGASLMLLQGDSLPCVDAIEEL
ncbi:MAG: phosphoglycerate kinase, partial [Clostridia bacterium]|nr:phosphoglycerate kinase [Clostridia bacterium]